MRHTKTKMRNVSQKYIPHVHRTADALCSRCSDLFPIFLVETLDTPRRIYEFLLPRKKRMAVRANLHVKVSNGGTGLKRVAANTSNNRLLILRVNSRFHLSLQRYACFIY